MTIAPPAPALGDLTNTERALRMTPTALTDWNSRSRRHVCPVHGVPLHADDIDRWVCPKGDMWTRREPMHEVDTSYGVTLDSPAPGAGWVLATIVGLGLARLAFAVFDTFPWGSAVLLAAALALPATAWVRRARWRGRHEFRLAAADSLEPGQWYVIAGTAQAFQATGRASAYERGRLSVTNSGLFRAELPRKVWVSATAPAGTPI